MGDIERTENIKTYFFRARKRIIGLVDGSDNQFYAEGLKDIWYSFDAFLGVHFPEKNNTLMRQKFCGKYQKIFESWNMSDDFKDAIIRLRILSPIPDMSPRNPRGNKSIKDTNNLSQILEASYRVRSNLTHGSKDLEKQDDAGRRNRALVKFSFITTYYLLEKVLINENIISV